MKLFGYYAFHTFINTFKKLFKTWVAVFILVCLVMGIGLGLLAVTIAENTPGEDEDVIILDTEYADSESDVLAEESDDLPEFMSERGLVKADIIELVVSAVVFGMLAVYVFSSKTASNIFKPGDVSILFSAPIKPQSVMLFRLLASMGLQLAVSIYMLGQLPNLIENVGMSAWGAIAMVLTWSIVLISGMLLQVVVYTIGSKHPIFKKYAGKVLLGIFLLIAAAYLVYTNQTGGDYLSGAVDMFTGEKTWWIPFWGWLRGFSMSAVAGNTVASLVYLGLTVVFSVVLILIIWNMDADFYEDAIGSVERTAEIIEKAKTSNVGGVARVRKKDRSDRLKRDGFTHGSGANVFFFKTMYNRFRFSFCGILTKTTLFYTALAVLMAFIFRDVEEFDNFIPVALALLLVVFYRTLGNPLQEDTSRFFFTMIPENMYAKLMYSLVGGSLCCLMDLVIPMTVSAIIVGAAPLTVIGWALVIASMDFFGTSVGTFIGVSVPVNGGNTIKQMIQILFMYFGIAPAGILIIIGLITGNVSLFTIIAALVNLGSGAVFFALTPHFLINGNQ